MFFLKGKNFRKILKFKEKGIENEKSIFALFQNKFRFIFEFKFSGDDFLFLPNYALSKSMLAFDLSLKIYFLSFCLIY